MRFLPQNLYKNTLLLVLSLAACFAILELWLRISPPENMHSTYFPKKNQKFDKELKRVLFPNLKSYQKQSKEFRYTITTNSKGFRDFHPLKKDKGIFRVLGLGDSFTFGYHVNEDRTYLSLLAGRFKNLETINLGQGGFSTAEEAIVLKRDGISYNPDLVMVQVYVNDIFDTYQFHTRQATPKTKSWLHAIILHSKLISRVFWSIKTAPAGNKLISLIGLDVDTRNSFSFIAKLSQQGGHVSRDIEQSIEWTRAAIRDIKAACDSNNIPVCFFYIPSYFQIDDSAKSSFLKRYHPTDSNIDLFKVQKIFRQLTEQEGIPFFDFTQEIKKRHEIKSIYYRYDNHLNPSGYRFLANLLATHILPSYLDKPKLYK